MKSFPVYYFVFVSIRHGTGADILNRLTNAGRGNPTQSKSDTSKSEKIMQWVLSTGMIEKILSIIVINIWIRIRNNRLDSSINDFDKYFSVPSSYQYLGNNGAAANSLIYKPNTNRDGMRVFMLLICTDLNWKKQDFIKLPNHLLNLSYQLASEKSK